MAQRIATGAVLIVILVVALALGGAWFSIPFMACVGLAIIEQYKALKEIGVGLVQWPVYLVYGLSIPILTIKLGGAAVLLPLVACACMMIVVQNLFSPKPSLSGIGFSILPLVSVVLPGMCMIGLLRAENRSAELMLEIMAFGIPLAGDTFAYFIGVIWGKHKFCEQVSPHKTTEGAIGGLFGSVLAAVIIWACFSAHGIMPFWHALLLGLLGGVTGQAGDLFASLIKRRCGIKDYGSIFPGHGGIMDRLDSVFWTAVLMYIYMTLFLP